MPFALRLSRSQRARFAVGRTPYSQHAYLLYLLKKSFVNFLQIWSRFEVNFRYVFLLVDHLKNRSKLTADIKRKSFGHTFLLFNLYFIFFSDTVDGKFGGSLFRSSMYYVCMGGVEKASPSLRKALILIINKCSSKIRLFPVFRR